MITIDSLEVLLEPLDEEARNTVMLAVSETWKVPPMTRETIVGDEDGVGWLKRWPSIINEESGVLDFGKVDKMMATGQIAYPMMLKKAPIISIVRSASGFTVKSADEDLAKVATANLQYILPKRIEEILTYLEYGAYFGEVTYEPRYPQEYGLPRKMTPYWVIEDLNGVHPNTVTKILRNENTKAFEGFVQQPMGFYEPIEIGTERALVIPNNGMFGNLNGDSVLEPVYVWWFWYELVWRAFLRFLQRAGVGVVVVKAPSRGRVEVQGKSVDNMQWALQMASGLHRTNYAAVPSDMDSDTGHPLWVVDYLKMGQNEGNQFISALELLSTNIKNYLLTGGSGGATEGAEFEVMLDTERILGHVGMYISEYTLPKMWHWNGSSTTLATLDFQGANSRVLPLLFKLMAVAGNTAGDALQNVDWRLLFNKGGVPVLSEEEVEELKEQKKQDQQEMFQQKQAASEKAKMPPGGEGRWTAKRDEEGQAERLEMVREALDVPLIALGAEQVAELEKLGLRVTDNPVMIYDERMEGDHFDPFVIENLDGDEVKLFNPYHDESGRFTEKEHAAKRLPENRFHAEGNVDPKAAFRAADATSLAYERMGQEPMDIYLYKDGAKFASAACGTSRVNIRCRRAAGKVTAFYVDGAIHVGPRGVKAIAKDRKLGEYIISHEAYHSRKRSDGSLEPNLDPKDSWGNWVKRDIEEGSADIMARRDSGIKHRSWLRRKPAYINQMGALAIIANKLSGGDRKKAWDIIDDIHYRINDFDYISDLLTKFTGGSPRNGWSKASMYALLVELQYESALRNYSSLGWMFQEE